VIRRPLLRNRASEIAMILPLDERSRPMARRNGADHPQSRRAEDSELGVMTQRSMLDRLRELMIEVDDVPEDVKAMAEAAYGMRSVDDELAELVYDSLIDRELLIGVRSTSQAARQLTFQSPHLVLEIEITNSEPRSLVCQAVPSQPTEMEVRTPRRVWRLGADDFGTFHLAAVPEGPLSFRCWTADGLVSSVTSWIAL
jgi:hypothetical protein